MELYRPVDVLINLMIELNKGQNLFHSLLRENSHSQKFL